MAFDTPDDGRPRRAPRPRDAATLILVRRDGGGPKVLMGRRPSSARFMPGKYVFPGGAVDRTDADAPACGELTPEDSRRLLQGCSLRRARALALAAIRETYEETGLLVGERAVAAAKAPAAWYALVEAGIAPRLDRLTYIARAITPPYRPQRFDARFFMADAACIAAEADTRSGELLERVWVGLDEARALDLPSITRRVLDEIAIRLDPEALAPPVPFFSFRRGKAQLAWL